MKRLTEVIATSGYYGSPNRENIYSIASLSVQYADEAYEKFPDCTNKEWLTNRAKERAVNEAIQKLGKHEDIEDKFGIELTLLVDAMSSGIYYIGINGHIKYLYHTEFWLCEGKFGYGWDYDPNFLYFENHGKKELGGWALTEEELK